MTVSEVIPTKRAVRQFSDEPLSEEASRTILMAGRRVQSSKNTQPWHFIVIRDRATLGQLAEFLRPLPFNNVEVGAAQASAADAHHDIPWPADLWFGYLLYLGKLMVLVPPTSTPSRRSCIKATTFF